MSTTPPPAATIAGRWSAFWFGPQDPTTLGFIRVTTGLLILYIHLAHSLDLQAFFGKNGWYNHAYMERERREYPWAVASFTDWTNDEVVMPRLPEYPHRRQAVMRFVRGLPGRPADRAATLRFLQSTAAEPPATSQATLTFLLGLVQTGKGQEARVAAALDDGRQLLVVDRHLLGRVPGLRVGLGNHRHHRIADPEPFHVRSRGDHRPGGVPAEDPRAARRLRLRGAHLRVDRIDGHGLDLDQQIARARHG